MFKGNTFFEKKFVKIIVFNKINVSNFFQNNQEGMLYKLFKYIYAPFLMKKWVRYVKIHYYFSKFHENINFFLKIC